MLTGVRSASHLPNVFEPILHIPFPRKTKMGTSHLLMAHYCGKDPKNCSIKTCIYSLNEMQLLPLELQCLSLQVTSSSHRASASEVAQTRVRCTPKPLVLCDWSTTFFSKRENGKNVPPVVFPSKDRFIFIGIIIYLLFRKKKRRRRHVLHTQCLPAIKACFGCVFPAY